jgi:hypothetical protein
MILIVYLTPDFVSTLSCRGEGEFSSFPFAGEGGG